MRARNKGPRRPCFVYSSKEGKVGKEIPKKMRRPVRHGYRLGFLDIPHLDQMIMVILLMFNELLCSSDLICQCPDSRSISFYFQSFGVFLSGLLGVGVIRGFLKAYSGYQETVGGAQSIQRA